MTQRIKVTSNSNSPNFIGAWMLEDKALCDDLVNFFEANPKDQGVGTTEAGIDENKKKTVDMSIKPKLLKEEKYKIFNSYIDKLLECFHDYKEQWPFLKSFVGMEIGTFNLQKYDPGGHFNAVHTERDCAANMHRILAFMTYLNDVEESGETSFHYYKINIKPERGKTIIWPAEWTHAHSGGIVKKGSKYIVTGWIQFSGK